MQTRNDIIVERVGEGLTVERVDPLPMLTVERMEPADERDILNWNAGGGQAGGLTIERIPNQPVEELGEGRRRSNNRSLPPNQISGTRFVPSRGSNNTLPLVTQPRSIYEGGSRG